MDEKLDKEIKHILKENEDIIVPKKISDGIDETLSNINKNEPKKYKKLAIVASIGFLLMLAPVAVKATRDVIYTYIPSLGGTIVTDSTIYCLEKPITNRIGNRIITVKEISYDTKSNMIMINVEGNGKSPENKGTIAINEKKIKSNSASIYEGNYQGTLVSWTGTYFFNYNKNYNGEDLEFSVVLDNGDIAKFNCKLTEAITVKDNSQLGKTSTNKNISITAVVNQEESILSVTLLNNLDKYNINAHYGEYPYPTSSYLDRTEEGIITLTDANNNRVKGKFVQNIDAVENKFIFDIQDLQKPFIIDIPEINVFLQENESISGVIELPIPVDNETININKEIELEVKNDIVKDSNKKAKIVSVKRDEDMYSIELEFLNENKENIQLINCVVVPFGESVSDKANGWFEGGLSGGMTEEGIKWDFKIPYPEAEKLYIKVLGREYKVNGPWSIEIE